jgi:hypothetical protein
MIIGSDAVVSNSSVFKEIVDNNFSIWKNGKICSYIREISKETLLKKYENLFKTELNEMTKCKLGEHRIITSGPPIVQKNIQIPKLWEPEIDSEVKRLLKSGIISHSKSSWASSIIPVRKKTGELRLCIDFRRINEITTRDNYRYQELTRF